MPLCISHKREGTPMYKILKVSLVACLISLINQSHAAEPPFNGTIFLESDIINDQDPTAFVGLRAAGQEMREMFDRRVDAMINVNAYLFVASYDDGLQIEIQVNPEFGSADAAQKEAEFYAPIFGRLPYVLRKDVQTSWIHQGDELFGGGNNNLLIHTGSIAEGYIRDGILEETLVHEASHTSLDATHARSEGWIEAQETDDSFISTYARDNPTGEDVAETFLTYLALKYRPHRIAANNRNTFRTTVPARNSYFDDQIEKSKLYPFEVANPDTGVLSPQYAFSRFEYASGRV